MTSSERNSYGELFSGMGNKKEFQIGMDKQSIGSGTIASRETEKEKQLVESSKELIQIYEKKIKDKIAAVWET